MLLKNINTPPKEEIEKFRQMLFFKVAECTKDKNFAKCVIKNLIENLKYIDVSVLLYPSTKRKCRMIKGFENSQAEVIKYDDEPYLLCTDVLLVYKLPDSIMKLLFTLSGNEIISSYVVSNIPQLPLKIEVPFNVEVVGDNHIYTVYRRNSSYGVKINEE